MIPQIQAEMEMLTLLLYALKMFKIKIFMVLGIFIFLISLIQAYSAPDYYNIDSTLNAGYEADSYNNIISILGEDELPVDTCTAPDSGDWEVDCSDNCTWMVSQNIPANIYIKGEGIINLFAEFNFTNSNQYINIDQRCIFNIESGGALNG